MDKFHFFLTASCLHVDMKLPKVLEFKKLIHLTEELNL